MPRDRQASFDPRLIAKYQRRFPGFDEKIVSMHARGMSTREIVGHPHDVYGIDVSSELISTVTAAMLDEVATWRRRPLDRVYPLVFLDAIRVKIRDEGMVRNKAIHIALGVRAACPREGEGRQGGAWAVARAERGRQVPAQGHERTSRPRRRGCVSACNWGPPDSVIGANDEVIADGIRRQHPHQHVVGELLTAEVADTVFATPR